jgi:hypothetical protein
MSRNRLYTVALGAAILALAGCDGSTEPAAAPSPEHAAAGVLLEPGDLPDGYALSPADVAPEVSAASSASVAGCDALLDYFRGGGATDGESARFEAGGTGPFLAEEISRYEGQNLADLAGRCANFTDTDGDGETTAVSVAPVGDFPKFGDEERVFRMSAGGGSGDGAFALSGYLLFVRIGSTTCTLVHFGQPDVERAETETIARAAVSKIRRRP